MMEVFKGRRADRLDFIGVGGGGFEKEGFLLVDFTGFGKKCEFIGRFHVSCKMLARVFAGGGRMGEFGRGLWERGYSIQSGQRLAPCFLKAPRRMVSTGWRKTLSCPTCVRSSSSEGERSCRQ